MCRPGPALALPSATAGDSGNAVQVDKPVLLQNPNPSGSA
jgi:hypothetical protein